MSVRLRNSSGWCRLPAGELLLGRHETCILHLDDPRLSRQHARLLVSQAALQIEDLGSANGVHLNGIRIEVPTACTHGDRLLIGPFTFEIEIEPDLPCPPELEGSLLDAELTAMQSNELLPSTDRHGPEGGTVVGPPPSGSQDSSLTPNPGSPPRRDPTAVVRQHDPNASERPTTAIRSPFETTEEPPTPAPVAAPPGLAGPHPFEQPESDSTSMINGAPSFQPQTRRKTTRALMPRDPKVRQREELRAAMWRRPLAGLLDLVGSQLLAISLVLPCLLGGYVLALRQAQAGVLDRAPIIIEGIRPASTPQLAATLLDANGWRAVPTILDTLRIDHRPAFLLFFVAATAAVLAWLLVTLSLLVAATMIKGGPYWHRRLGLSIHDRHSGLSCSPGRSATRWLLVAVIGWMAPVFIVLCLPSPHDVISGCLLRYRRHES
jgi:hypothetical protein